MASPVAAEEHSNTKSEEGTTVFHKKRSRRVSFAENTSVHIFDRDEEINTPPDPDAPSSPSENLGFSDRDSEQNQFSGNEDEDMDEIGSRSPFFRVVRSPSSGGSTIGSATSNDEDNFFGPVSAKFIRRDLSDSIDGNHEHTMDSTSFSMHFNSIARSDSEAELKTSTGVHLSFDEKTPTSSMLLTLDKKPICQPDVSISKFSTGSQSNDMSLVGEYHDKYDYGKLSPASDAHNDKVSPLKDGKQVLANKENEYDGMDFSYGEDNKMVCQSDDVMEKENKSFFTEMPCHMVLNSVPLLKSPGTFTANNLSSFFLKTESQKRGSFSLSSLQKSISKLRILEASPFSTSLNAKLQDSKSKSLLGISKMTPFSILEKNNRSPVNKELYSVLKNDNIAPVPVKNVQPSSVTSATRKRKTEDMMTEKIARIKSSSRFFKETKLFSHSVDKMNLHTIDRMVDILELFQRSKTYEILSNEIQSQTIPNSGSNIQEKRTTETRLLLCKIVHEKAKLQLMQVKRERLLKNKQSLASGIQESEALKSKYSLQKLFDSQVIHQQPFSENTKDIKECQVDSEKVTLLSEEIKDTDGRISNLMESFHVLFKMKEEVGPTDTIVFVNNHLMERARCQIIRKDFQLWVIEDLKSNKDHSYVVLNYLDLITERFTMTPGVVTSISVSNILNETNILKNFKDMEALTAFQFVFNAGYTQTHLTDTNLAHETQFTSSLLGNLVDVMEEIQLARIELKNLINARFHTVLDEQLYLDLYFSDPITRNISTLTLNTSCLKRGIYPSQLDIQSQWSISSSLSNEIETEVKNLKVGFSSILRLCKCISKVVSRSR